jgi:tetraacyldisaccharide 4'-kinase
MTWRTLLLPLSVVYWLIAAVRNLLFEKNVLVQQKVGVPVVCVGNISAGGVGKTPLVEFLSRQFRSRGKKVAILSRGYGRRGSGYLVASNGKQRCAEIWDAGDEASELANALDGVVVAVDENRVRGANKLIEQFHPDVIVLDDGFQHRALEREYNIVVMTAKEVLGGELLLPAGNRREPLSALRRAHCVVITKSRDDSELQRARLKIEARFKGGVYGMNMVLHSITKASSGENTDLEQLSGRKALLFSGIGQPDHFQRTLLPIRLEVVRHIRFADHHWFSDADIGRIQELFTETKSELMITTRKDVQRLASDRARTFLAEFPLYIANIRPQFAEGETDFLNELDSTVWSSA